MKNQTTLQWLTALILLIGFTALYYSTRTEVHTFDALSYTQDVETKPMGLLYHPHHLLYGPLGRMTVDLAEAFGYEGRADAPIQALNALAGAIGVLLLWWFGVLFTRQVWRSLPIAIMIGLTYAYWFYATEVEVYTLAAVFIVLAMALLVRLERTPDLRNAILLGLAHAGAVMFHQTNLLFVLPVGLFLLSERRLWRCLLPYGFTLVGAVAIPYLLVAWHSDLRDADSIYHWLTDYAQSGNWGGYLSFDHLDALWSGLKNTISYREVLAIVFYGLAFAGLVIGGRELARRWWVFGMAWLLLYGGFFWWWEPWNIEFWIALLPLWALWMYTGIKLQVKEPSPVKFSDQRNPHQPPPLAGEARRGSGAAGDADTGAAAESEMNPGSDYWLSLSYGYGLRRRALMTLLPGLLALMLFEAHWNPIRTAADPENDYYRHITEALDPVLNEQDYVLTRGNILDLYVDFYAGHPPDRIWSLRNRRWGGADPLPDLLNEIDHAYRTGRIVFIDAAVLEQPADPQTNPFGFSAAEIEVLKERFPIQPAVEFGGSTVFYSVGEPTVNASAWAFENSLQGWIEFGAENPRYENGGWCISGYTDPWIESPPVTLDSTQFTQVELALLAQNVASDVEGQLFWRHEGEDLNETQSLRFPIEEGRQTYTFDLAGQPGWEGTIVFLRLDFPSETESCLYRIEFRQ